MPEGSTWDLTIDTAGAAAVGDTTIVTTEGAPEPAATMTPSIRPAALAQAFATRLELARVWKPLVRGGGIPQVAYRRWYATDVAGLPKHRLEWFV